MPLHSLSIKVETSCSRLKALHSEGLWEDFQVDGTVKLTTLSNLLRRRLLLRTRGVQAAYSHSQHRLDLLAAISQALLPVDYFYLSG